MNRQPEIIKLCQISEVIAENFKQKDTINCYVGSNAAVPTASIEALTEAIKNDTLNLPFFKMIHLLLQGPVPYTEKGLQDRVMTYSIFSGGEVRKAANKGRAFYLPCTLAHLDNSDYNGFGGYGNLLIFNRLNPSCSL